MGRPTDYYRLPSNVELARLLGVQLSSITDILTLDDLKSAKSTRMALHFRFIERRPGKYSTRWLSKRLGVSKVTKNRYDRALPGLHKRATHTIKPIYWNTLDEIPDEYDVPGQFLEDEQGKRYPAKKVIAIKLLKQKLKVRLMTRGFNYYWVGHRFEVDTDALATVITNNRKLPDPDFSTYWEQTYRQPAAHKAVRRSASHSGTPQIQTSSIQDGTRPANSSGWVSPAHTDTSHEAGYIQSRANQLATHAAHKLSLSTATHLVEQYGAKTVINAIKRIENRTGVENPAGLLVVILRSEAKWGKTKTGS